MMSGEGGQRKTTMCHDYGWWGSLEREGEGDRLAGLCSGCGFGVLPVVEGVEELEDGLVEDEDGRGGAALRPQVVHGAVQLGPRLRDKVVGGW